MDGSRPSTRCQASRQIFIVCADGPDTRFCDGLVAIAKSGARRREKDQIGAGGEVIGFDQSVSRFEWLTRVL